MATRPHNLVRMERSTLAAAGRLDRIDLRILSCLQKDATLSVARIGEIVGLSSTPCLRRIRRLEAEDYVRSCGAEIDTARLGSHLIILTEIVLKTRSAAHVQPFERYVATQECFLDCYAVTGDCDYIIRVVARDVDHHYRKMEELTEHCSGVVRYNSTIALRTIKQTRDIPIALFDPANLQPVDHDC